MVEANRSTGHSDLKDELQQHLVQALRSKAQGASAEEYNNLVTELGRLKKQAVQQKDQEQDFYLCNLIESLIACISVISEGRHESLICELYTIPLWDCTEELRGSVLSFMLHLVVVNSTLTQQTLQVLVHSLNLPFARAQAQPDVPADEWRLSEQALAVQNDVIATLEQILELIPVSGSLLMPILARGVPNKVLSRSMQCTYLRALLRIAELPRAAAFRDTILAAVMQHLVALDVEIRWQDIAFAIDDEDEEDDNARPSSPEDGDIFELEGQTEQLQLDPSKFPEHHQPPADVERREGDLALERITGRGGFEGEAQDNAPSTSGRPEIDETAEKLDSMMFLVFEYLRTRASQGQLQRTWQAVLDSFFTTVLNTHKSKFTQYLLWYLLDQDPEACGWAFLKQLLATLADPRQPDITRSAAAAYIASFLARAAFLPEPLLLEAIEKLADWCLQYCRRHDASLQLLGLGPPAKGAPANPQPQGVVHQVFYAACQGLLYVLCYRLEQLVAGKAGSAGEETLNPMADSVRRLFKDAIPVLLQSRLAPMAVCLPTVVAEFTRLTSRLALMDCRALLPGGADVARCQRPLEMFFPFDPYLLRRSAAFLDLRRTFVRWKAGHSQPVDDEAEAAESRSASSSQYLSDADEEGNKSGSETSGLESDEDNDSEEEEEEEEEEYGEGKPRQDRHQEASGVVPPQQTAIKGAPSAGRRILSSREAAASYSSAGTGSPPCPMSWTPRLQEGSYGQHQQALLRPLDVHD